MTGATQTDASPVSAPTDDGVTDTADESRDAHFAWLRPHSGLAVVLAATGLMWPGGRSALADELFTIGLLGALLAAVVRHPGFKDLFAAAPPVAKWGAKLLLAAFLIGQFWGASDQTFPVATWTMYSGNPGDEAAVIRFEAVNGTGEPVVFTPNEIRQAMPSKLALVRLRRLSIQLHRSSIGSDADQLAADEEALRQAVVAVLETHNDAQPNDRAVRAEVSRVTYDVTDTGITIASGDKTVLLSVDLAAS